MKTTNPQIHFMTKRLNCNGSHCKGERVKPWPDWALWLMFVLCLVASIGIALCT